MGEVRIVDTTLRELGSFSYNAVHVTMTAMETAHTAKPTATIFMSPRSFTLSDAPAFGAFA
jgi:hypothetical protein